MKLRAVLLLASTSLFALGSVAMAQESSAGQTITLDLVTIIADGKDNVEATGGTVVSEEDLRAL